MQPSQPQRHPDYQKPTILMDLKPTKDAEALIKECEQFITSIKQQQQPSGVARMQKMSSWRKLNVGSMMSSYEKLQPRIADSEKILRGVLVGNVTKKDVLRTQAHHLVNRLQSCVVHQNVILDEAEKPIQELRVVVDQLANESTSVKLMVKFNNEVLRQKNVQSVRQGKSFMPWSKKKSTAIISEQDLANDPDHPALHQRLHELRLIRDRVVHHLTQLLEKKEQIAMTMDSCLQTRIQLQQYVKNYPLALDDAQAESDMFDHSRCSDCNSSQAIACDCIDHFVSLDSQTSEASKSLKLLVETREKMRDFVDFVQSDQEMIHHHESSEESAPTPRPLMSSMTSSIASYISSVYDDFQSSTKSLNSNSTHNNNNNNNSHGSARFSQPRGTTLFGDGNNSKFSDSNSLHGSNSNNSGSSKQQQQQQQQQQQPVSQLQASSNKSAPSSTNNTPRDRSSQELVNVKVGVPTVSTTVNANSQSNNNNNSDSNRSTGSELLDGHKTKESTSSSLISLSKDCVENTPDQNRIVLPVAATANADDLKSSNVLKTQSHEDKSPNRKKKGGKKN